MMNFQGAVLVCPVIGIILRIERDAQNATECGWPFRLEGRLGYASRLIPP
jgi:hypothetical protein